MCAACLPCDPWNWVVLLPHPTLTFSADNVDEGGDKGGDKGGDEEGDKGGDEEGDKGGDKGGDKDGDKGEYEVEIISVVLV